MSNVRTFLIVFFSLAAAMLASCENDIKQVEALTKKGEEIEVGKNIKGLFSESANLKAELSSPLMYRVKADTNYTEFPKTLHVDFYNDLHIIESVVNAKYGKYFDNLNKVYLRDSVVVYKVTGDTLYCEDLWWDQNANTFTTDLPVRIHTPQQALKGSGLWALANFKSYKIINPKGLIDIPEEVQ
jgi:LPS export ABC transporter protein LptC